MNTSNRAQIRSRQFSLRSLLVFVTMVACACGTIRYLTSQFGANLSQETAIELVTTLLAIPLLICGAIGVLRGRLVFWLSYGLVLGLTIVAIGLILILNPPRI